MDEKNKFLQEIKYIPTVENDQKLKAESEIKKSDTWFLYLAVLTGQLILIVCGTQMVWTSPALIKLKSNDTNINPVGLPVTTLEVSMIAGLPGLFAIIGTLVLAKLSDFIGRKKFLQLMAVFMLITAIGLALSKTVIYMIITRCIIGVFITGIWAVLLIYVTEICEDHNRTKFGCFLGLFNQVGNLFVFVVGPMFSIQNFTFITFSPALLFLIFSFFIPESPIYLLSKGKKVECQKALILLRNNKNNDELEKDFIKIEKSLTEIPKANNILSLINKRQNRFALLLAIFPITIQFLSGLAVLMPFLAPFFNSAGTSISGNNAAILVSLVKISCFTFTTFVVQKFGRKRMLIISAIGSGVSIITLGFYFYLKDNNSSIVIHLQWLPLTSLLSIVVFYSFGLGPIPLAIVGELFPSDIRAAATSFIVTLVSIIGCALTLTYPFITEAFGMHWCMWMFGLCCFIGAILIYFFLPQTEGKSFIEIQEILKKY